MKSTWQPACLSGSCSKHVTQSLEALHATLSCHWDPSYTLVQKKNLPPPTISLIFQHSYVEEPIFAVFKAPCRKRFCEIQATHPPRLLMDWGTIVCSFFAKENTLFPSNQRLAFTMNQILPNSPSPVLQEHPKK